MIDDQPATHTAFARKRLGKRHFTWLEIGTGRIDGDGVFHGFLDRTPIGGFDGYVHFVLIGTEPSPAQPQRPDHALDGEEM